MAINEVETKYQSQQKEKENQLLKNEKRLQEATIKSQQIIMWSAFVGIGLLSLIAFLIYRQNQKEKQANSVLAEKNKKIETLHKELGHRVKNNLAFISSLIQMQEGRIENEAAKQALKEGEHRINAIALLHRKFYLQEESTVNMGTYLKELCGNLAYTYPSPSNGKTIKLNADDIELDGETAMRIGLIINELVTNSYKHAFANQAQSEINIRLKKGDHDALQLTYRDNGQGLPADIDLEKTASLGLKLVKILTQQLKGTLNTKNDHGAFFQIDFKHQEVKVLT